MDISGDDQELLAFNKSEEDSSTDSGDSFISQANERLYSNASVNMTVDTSAGSSASAQQADLFAPEHAFAPAGLHRIRQMAALQILETQNKSDDIVHAAKLRMMQAQNQTADVLHATEKYIEEHLIEFSLSTNETDGFKSKLVLSLIEFSCLGLCGIDRCYMGQMQLGLAKGLTGGGLLIWWLLDYGLIAYNCLSSSLEINGLEYSAKFKPGDELAAAFWICVVMNIVSMCCLGSGTKMQAARRASRTGGDTAKSSGSKGTKQKVPDFAKIPNKMLQKGTNLVMKHGRQAEPEPVIKRSQPTAR